jgi:D-amino-acid dehydrogenase
MPGTVAKALKWMWKKDAPLYIKPRLDWRLAKWLFQFQRRCTMEDVRRAAEARATMLDGAMQTYSELAESESMAFEWQASGIVFAFNTEQGLAAYRSVDAFERQFGVDGTPLTKEAVMQLEPALGPGVVGGWHYEKAGHLRPDFLLRELKTVLTRRGVVIREGVTVRSFVADRGRATAAITDQGPVSADAFVLATGAWSRMFEASCEMKLPIEPGKGYSTTWERPASGPRLPCLFSESKVVITPWSSSVRLGGTMEFSGFNDSVPPARIDALARGVAPYLTPAAAAAFNGSPDEKWCGWRPMTTDGLPIIEISPALSNVLVAAGHNMVGISTGPATGRLVAEILSQQSPSIDPAPFAANRF